MARTSLALVAALFASLGIHSWITPFPSPSYCLAMMMVDALAALVVLIRPAGKVQSLVGITYLVQIGLYAGYLGHPLLNNENGDIYSLWLGLSVMAMLQLALVGGWWVHERVPWGGLIHRGGAGSVAAHRQSHGP